MWKNKGISADEISDKIDDLKETLARAGKEQFIAIYKTYKKSNRIALYFPEYEIKLILELPEEEQEEAIDKAIDKGEDLDTLYTYVGKKFTLRQIDKAIDKGEDLDYLYGHVGDKFTPQQIDKALDKGQYLGALYLSVGKNFTPQQIDKAIGKGKDLYSLYEYVGKYFTPEQKKKYEEKTKKKSGIDKQSSESIMLVPMRDLETFVDFKYPDRHKKIPKGHRPFMRNEEEPVREQKEVLPQEEHNMFFGPSYPQNVRQYYKVSMTDLNKQYAGDKFTPQNIDKAIDKGKYLYTLYKYVGKNFTPKQKKKYEEKVKKKKASILDYPKPGLDLSIWTDEGILKEAIKIIVLDTLSEFFNSKGIQLTDVVDDIVIIGSLTTYQYNSKSDLDVHSLINYEKFKDQLYEAGQVLSKKQIVELLDKTWRKELSERCGKAPNTEHPIEFYFELEGELGAKKEDGIYSILKDEWLQAPRTVDLDYDIAEIYPEVIGYAEDIASEMDIEIGEIKRDIKNIEFLQETIAQLDGEKKKLFKEKLDNKVKEIEDSILEIVETGKDVIDKRKKKEYDPESEANVNFKYLQRYGYLWLVKQLGKALEDKATEEVEVEDTKDVDKVEDILDRFETEPELCEKIKARNYRESIAFNKQGGYIRYFYDNSVSMKDLYRCAGYMRYFYDNVGYLLGYIEVEDNGDSKVFDMKGQIIGYCMGGKTYDKNGFLVANSDVITSFLMTEERMQI